MSEVEYSIKAVGGFGSKASLNRNLDGSLSRWRIGVMTMDVAGGGMFTRWTKGEIVKVAAYRSIGQRGLSIQKLKPIEPFLPLRSSCVGIPKTAVRIIKDHPAEYLP